MEWDRSHVSKEGLKIASLFSTHSGFQQDTRVTRKCWVRQIPRSVTQPLLALTWGAGKLWHPSVLQASLILRLGWECISCYKRWNPSDWEPKFYHEASTGQEKAWSSVALQQLGKPRAMWLQTGPTLKASLSWFWQNHFHLLVSPLLLLGWISELKENLHVSHPNITLTVLCYNM